jgi:MtN3 and saliva related transmembrane protein
MLMNHLFIEILGYLAAALTTLSFAPQAFLIWKTRSTKSISLGMYSAFVAGIGVWLIYGFLISSWPLVASNGITFVLSGTILCMKLRFG